MNNRMKHLSEIDLTIIDVLNDLKSHSGNALAARLGLSRTAIWKHIQQLRSLGLPIISKQTAGYTLSSPVYLISAKKLLSFDVLEPYLHQLNLHLFATLDSTNAYLKSLALNHQQLDVCISESQTNGRGRFKREWFSPFGENLYCSLRYVFKEDVSKLSGLSLIVSMALLEAIKDCIDDIHGLGIKWPNDLFCNGKKLAGSLIELVVESHTETVIVIGIGLNVNMLHAELSNQWTSLRKITGKHLDKNKLAAHILHRVYQALSGFSTIKKAAFMTKWTSYDVLYQKKIKVQHYDSLVEGLAEGIDEDGNLLIRLANGDRTTLCSGEASLHKE